MYQHCLIIAVILAFCSGCITDTHTQSPSQTPTPDAPETVGKTPPNNTSSPTAPPLAGQNIPQVPVAALTGGVPTPDQAEIIPVPTLQAPLTPAPSPHISERLASIPALDSLLTEVNAYFEGFPGHRIYIQADKPLYRPGETVWLRAWDLKAKDLSSSGNASSVFQLISPKGAVVMEKRVQSVNGVFANDFIIPEGVQGGEYQLRVIAADGTQENRPIIVNHYEPPRIKKKLEFVRKAYGAGDEVTATLELKRPTGEPLANRTLSAAIRLDGIDLPRVAVSTNADGNALVRFLLPTTISRGDGLLTVLVDDGGITESVSKRIPIVMESLNVKLYPEGGQLVSGLPSRVYFEAQNMLGEPADIVGQVLDDQGKIIVERFESVRDGFGRFGFEPQPGRSYHVKVLSPEGIKAPVALPAALASGCVLTTFDDFDGVLPALRAGVMCSELQEVVVSAVLRSQHLDAARVKAGPTEYAVVHLQPKDAALAKRQGVARVTVFNSALQPLAERLVYRGRRDLLSIEVTAQQPRLSPRDQVKLSITAKDSQGEPVAGSFALSVVDDTVLSYADDKTGHMLSRLFLEPELQGEIKEPNFYFDLKEPKSAEALDMLVGARGWRMFEWKPIVSGDWRKVPTVPTITPPTTTAAPMPDLQVFAMPVAPLPPAPPQEPPQPEGIPAVPSPEIVEIPAADAPHPVEEQMAKRGKNNDDIMAGGAIAGGLIGGDFHGGGQGHGGIAAGRGPRDRDWDNAAGEAMPMQQIAWAPVRVFPVPDYSGANAVAATRTDFRETIFWSPDVTTDATGKAEVSFYLSDAVTSFRVTTEGATAGAAGRHETVISSSLPFSMDIKLPLEVSAGDVLQLPLTLTNERKFPTSIALTASFGELVSLTDAGRSALKTASTLEVPPGERASLFLELNVTGQQGKSEINFDAKTEGLHDGFKRAVVVVPPGFPQEITHSGQVKGSVTHTVDLGQAIDGTFSTNLRFYPSPMATMMGGLEGMLRQPGGCFEQTSSGNYPNIMVLQYIQESGAAVDPKILERSQHYLDEGYQRLTGYESKSGGFEWFGADPGHEALTAYGIMQFTDMKAVYSKVSQPMIDRTIAWLVSREDGKGGFKQNPHALHTWTTGEVTDAYILYSLSESGIRDYKPGNILASRLASDSSDPYILALAVNTLLNDPSTRDAGLTAASRLASMQDKKGVWQNAKHSVTLSTGFNLEVETTALALLALLKTDQHRDAIDAAARWLLENRGGYGEWGTTQATVLALKSLVAYTQSTRRTQSSGTLTLTVNGQQIEHISYDAGHQGYIDFKNFSQHLRPGPNEITLTNDSAEPLPYSLNVDFRSTLPANSPDATVELKTSLERNTVKMGESVRLNAVIRNKKDQSQPMTLVRVGLPGGLTFQTWQLKELRDRGQIAFYETRPREVILYFRDLQANEEKIIPIDLVAAVPGRYQGPASSAYLYYTDEHKHWSPGLNVTIEKP